MGINPTLAHTDNMGNLVRGHLNLQLSLKVTRATAPEAHGILGQTVNMDMGIDMAEPVCSCPPAHLCLSSSHGHCTSCPLPACVVRS